MNKNLLKRTRELFNWNLALDLDFCGMTKLLSVLSWVLSKYLLEQETCHGSQEKTLLGFINILRILSQASINLNLTLYLTFEDNPTLLQVC